MERSQLVKNLCFLMEKRRETANAVAVSCGLKASTLTRLLDGSSSAPRNSTLQALAIHFGVHPNMLEKGDLSTATEELFEHKSLSEPVPLLTEEEVIKIYYLNEEDTAKGNFFSHLRPTGERKWVPAPACQELIDLIKESSDSLLAPIFAITIEGDAMAPKFTDGDIVYILYTPTDAYFDDEGNLSCFSTPDEIKSGDFVLAFTSNKEEQKETDNQLGNMLLRQFCPGDASSKKDFLLTTNPDWPGDRTLICERIIGKPVFRSTKI